MTGTISGEILLLLTWRDDSLTALILWSSSSEEMG
jgi:hypothetical protein